MGLQTFYKMLVILLGMTKKYFQQVDHGTFRESQTISLSY